MSAVSKKVTPASSAAFTTFVVPAWSRREPKLLHPTPTTDTCSDPRARVSIPSPHPVASKCTHSLPRSGGDNYDGVKSSLEGVPMKVVVDYDACSSNAVCMGRSEERRVGQESRTR